MASKLPKRKTDRKIFIAIVVIVAGVLIATLSLIRIPSSSNGNSSSYDPKNMPPGSYYQYESGWWDDDPIVKLVLNNFGPDTRVSGFDTLRDVTKFNTIGRNIWVQGGIIGLWAADSTFELEYCDYFTIPQDPPFDDYFGDVFTEFYTGYWELKLSSVNNFFASNIDDVSITSGEIIIMRHSEFIHTVVVKDGAQFRQITTGCQIHATRGDYVIFKPFSVSGDVCYAINYEWFNLQDAANSGEFDRAQVLLKSPSFEDEWDGGFIDWLANCPDSGAIS